MQESISAEITALKNKIAELQEVNHRLLLENLTLDAIGDGILVIDRSGSVIRINQKFLNMWEITPLEWESCHTYEDVKQLMSSRLHPEVNDMSIQDILRPTVDRLGLDDITLKNGRIYERYAGIKRLDDNIIGYVWSFRDVTQRRQATLELNRSQAFLNRIIRNLPVILIAYDLNGKVIFSRGAALSGLGLEQRQLEGLNILEEYKDHQFIEAIKEAITGKPVSGTYDFDGIIHEVYMGPMYESGKLVGVIGIRFDVTERKRAQEVIEIGKKLQAATRQAVIARRQAEEANLAKSTFIANMSHELRTPLNSIIGFSQFMVRDRSLNGEQQKYMSLIMQSSEQLLVLINEILDIAKIESGNIQLNPIDFDLIELLEGLGSIYYAKVVDQNMMFVSDVADNVPRYLHGDRNKIRQMLVNLLSNAVKFTQSGVITLKVWSSSDHPYHLYLQVRDTGVGISEDELQTLFEPFAQAEDGRKSGSGTGLGLTITHEFAKLMHGYVNVESEVGVGSVFTIFVRLEPAKDTVTPGHSHTLHVIGTKQDIQHKILIVDDRWENRMMLSKMLTRVGFVVQEASDGHEAIQIWKDWSPDLIWMDIRMPNMDGYEATQRIRQAKGGDDVVIIALTASAFEQDRERVMMVGCDDFLAKPFREADMYDKLSRHLGIEFLYEEIPTDTPVKQPESDEAITLFSSLSDSTRLQLKNAINELNLQKVHDIVRTFEADHPDLAKKILTRANEFDFDTLGKWVS